MIGLIAHVDTTPETPGGGVVPIVHEDYAGGPIVLPGDPSQVIDPAEETELAARVGHDIVTSDGTTLLGADDKAGVAEIMAAVALPPRTRRNHARRCESRSRSTRRSGAEREHFDLEAFGAEAAYTLDGSGIGELEIETFSARQVRVTIRGRGAHPGSAKGKLVNAVKLAADFVASLPQGSLSPETTEGREGFVHPSRVTASVEDAVVTLIVRDHDDALLEQHTELVRRLALAIEEREPRARVTVEVQETYRNMRAAIDAAPAGRRGGRGSDPPGRHRAGSLAHPRRHRRRPALGDGPADPEHLHRRPELPLDSASGRACRTWPQRRRRSSSSCACGPNRSAERDRARLMPRPTDGGGAQVAGARRVGASDRASADVARTLRQREAMRRQWSWTPQPSHSWPKRRISAISGRSAAPFSVSSYSTRGGDSA